MVISWQGRSTMRIDDFTLFGRTVPEESKKYGIKVCGAGYSKELKSLMRIYPIPVECDIKARQILKIELERSKQDSRAESWALKTRDHESIVSDSGFDTKKDIQHFLENNISTIDDLNDRRLSLGVLKPEEIKVVMRTRDAVRDPAQMTLFDDFESVIKPCKVAVDYFKIPYIKLPSGKQRMLQIREWGVYELMRKYETKITADYIKNALHISDDKDVYFVVGNMNQFRNTWLVIKVFVFQKDNQMTLFE